MRRARLISAETYCPTNDTCTRCPAVQRCQAGFPQDVHRTRHAPPLPSPRSRSARTRSRRPDRVRAAMIRPQTARLRVLDCEVDTLRRCVTRDDAAGEWRLTPKALQVLLVLVESQDGVVTREALFERVWPHTMPTDDVLTQAVTQLRK